MWPFSSQSHVPRTEKERQNGHQRDVQKTLLWLLSIGVILGYTSLFYAQVIMNVAEKELTQFWQAQMMLLTSWVGLVGITFGTSLYNPRNQNQVQEDKKGE